MRNTLNRKYLSQAIDGSLERFGLDFVDLVFCHRPDPETPIEETVWAMSDMVGGGKALYWGTSEWSADEIRGRMGDRRAPPPAQAGDGAAAVQPVRAPRRSSSEYARLYDDIGLGLTTWSPLASGLLTGKYLDGMPEGSRAALPGYEWLRRTLTDERRNAKVATLARSPSELGLHAAQLAIAWCAANPHVSTVITGASRPEQVDREHRRARCHRAAHARGPRRHRRAHPAVSEVELIRRGRRRSWLAWRAASDGLVELDLAEPHRRAA